MLFIHNVLFVPVSLFLRYVEHEHEGSRCTCSIRGDLARTEERRRPTAALRCWTRARKQTNEFAARTSLHSSQSSSHSVRTNVSNDNLRIDKGFGRTDTGQRGLEGNTRVSFEARQPHHRRVPLSVVSI
jgi:hypothetical protein